MAYRPNTRGRHLLILIGDGGSPEVFRHPCWLNGDRGLSREAQVTEENDRDCAAPYLPGWLTRTVDGKSATINGAGRIKVADQSMFDEWFASGEARNVRVMVGSGDDAPMYQGAFKLTSLNLQGGETGSMTGSLTLQSHGVFYAIGGVGGALDLGDANASGFNLFFGVM